MSPISDKAARCGPPSQRRTNSAAAWLLAAAVLIALAFLLDDAVIAWVNAHQIKRLKNAAGWISEIGDWPAVFGAGLLLLTWASVTGKLRWQRIVSLMLFSGVAAGIIANTLRELCGRTRPNAKIAPGWYGLAHDGNWLSHSNQFHSFPSGHSAVIMAFCLPLLVFAPKVGRPAMLAVVLVAASRLYLNVHHLSDVTASLFIGAGCFALVREISERRQARAHSARAGARPAKSGLTGLTRVSD